MAEDTKDGILTLNNDAMAVQQLPNAAAFPAEDEDSLFVPQDEDRPTKRARLESDEFKRGYMGKDVEEYTPGEPYNYEKHEILARIPSNHPSLKRAENLTESTIIKLREVIVRCSVDDPTKPDAIKDIEIKNLAAQLHEKRRPWYGNNTTFALLGDTGTGKSTLLNNLLGKEGLAKMICPSHRL